MGAGPPDHTRLRRPASAARARRPAFRNGIHYCPGVPPARLEATIALRTLLTRNPELELLVPADPLQWIGSGIVRGGLSLPALRATAVRRRPGPRTGRGPGRCERYGRQTVSARSRRDFQPSSRAWRTNHTPPPVAYTDSTSSEVLSPAAWTL